MYITAGEKTDFFKGGSFRLFFTANTDLYLYPPGGNREATLLCEMPPTSWVELALAGLAEARGHDGRGQRENLLS